MKIIPLRIGIITFCLIAVISYGADKYSDQKLTQDVNAIAALVDAKYADHVVHFLIFGTSGIKGERAIPTAIAKNEINKIDGSANIHLPLARVMRRMALRTESAKDARQFAFIRLKLLAPKHEDVRTILVETATELSKRETDDLKKSAADYLKDSER
jgi:hypothetical protein